MKDERRVLEFWTWVVDWIWLIGYVVLPLIAMLVALATRDYQAASEWGLALAGFALFCLFIVSILVAVRKVVQTRNLAVKEKNVAPGNSTDEQR